MACPNQPIPTMARFLGRVSPRMRRSSLFIIHDGYVKLSQITPDGNERILNYAGPEELIGDLFPNIQTQHLCDATAITTIEMERAPHDSIWFMPEFMTRSNQAASPEGSLDLTQL